MARYIDADEALKTIKKMLYETALNNFTTDRKFSNACEEIAEHRLATWIDIIPTADVAEVVRCRDCVHYKAQEEARAYRYGKTKVCARSALVCTKPTDFCSFGERREDDQTNDLRQAGD